MLLFPSHQFSTPSSLLSEQTVLLSTIPATPTNWAAAVDFTIDILGII